MGRRVILVALALGCGTNWRANVPPKYMHVAEIHHGSCGNCHTRVEPGQRTRAAFEKALSRHHTRVKMSDDEWVVLIDYLSQTP